MTVFLATSTSKRYSKETELAEHRYKRNERNLSDEPPKVLEVPYRENVNQGYGRMKKWKSRIWHTVNSSLKRQYHEIVYQNLR